MTIVVLIIVVLALVIGLGILIFSLMRRSQKVVPEAADRRAAETEQVVAEDDQGRPVMESQDGPLEPPRDASAFENVLGQETEDLHPGRGD
jgi:flagellar biosynthesis/type III secretory pathway M-ring protein FliF/YscJ